jgi:hypothetical protein
MGEPGPPDSGQDGPPPRSAESKGWAHPAVLLILGFVLTTATGGYLSHLWQAAQWDHQQERAWNDNLIKTKYAIIGEVNTHLGETLAAARGILPIVERDWNEKSQRSAISNRIDSWEKADLTWRTKTYWLRSRVGAYFDDPQSRALDSVISSIRRLEQPLRSIVDRLHEPTAKEHPSPVGCGSTKLPAQKESRKAALLRFAKCGDDALESVDQEATALNIALVKEIRSKPEKKSRFCLW